MAPRLIGASLGRTGTQSVAAALGELGLKCYGMREIIARRAHQQAWRKALQDGALPEWDALLSGYDATIGWPICFFVEELAGAYPAAKFVLTLRDADSWFDSFSRSWAVLSRLRMFRFVPRVRGVLSVVEPVIERLGGVPLDRDRAIAAYEWHIELVRSVVNPDRLLEYQVSDGWGPLCRFLELPVPASAFPRSNTAGDSLRQMVSQLIGQRG